MASIVEAARALEEAGLSTSMISLSRRDNEVSYRRIRNVTVTNSHASDAGCPSSFFVTVDFRHAPFRCSH